MMQGLSRWPHQALARRFDAEAVDLGRGYSVLRLPANIALSDAQGGDPNNELTLGLADDLDDDDDDDDDDDQDDAIVAADAADDDDKPDDDDVVMDDDDDDSDDDSDDFDDDDARDAAAAEEPLWLASKDLVLASLKEALQAHDLQADIKAGMLVCASNIVVKKHDDPASKRQTLVVDGPFSPDYFTVSAIVKEQFTLV